VRVCSDLQWQNFSNKCHDYRGIDTKVNRECDAHGKLLMKENNANKDSDLSVEKCIVIWDNLDECANRIPEPFCETNNEHGKGETP